MLRVTELGRKPVIVLTAGEEKYKKNERNLNKTSGTGLELESSVDGYLYIKSQKVMTFQ